MSKRDVSYMKPEKFKGYFTLAEASREVGRDPSRIRRLEADGKIPQAARVSVGTLKVRLWSPAQVSEIKVILSKMRPGRPSK